MLKTEMRNPRTMHIDEMATEEMVDTMISESYNAIKAVEAVKSEIASAVETISEAIAKGGNHDWGF